MSELKVRNVISLWMLLLLALAKPLLNGAQATLLARVEFRSIVLVSRMQQAVTRCIFLLVTQKLTGFFTSNHSKFIIGKSFSRKYCPLFSRTHAKTQLIATTLPVMPILLPNKTTISISLP